MSKKLVISAAAVIVLAVGGYFAASKMGLLGSGLVAEAERMAEITCACEDFECTLPQTQWFNKNGAMNADAINALSDEDGERYRLAREKNAQCQNERRE